ncbi:MAG TPA: hypothetical protein VFX04_10265 [Rhodanobacteraceae bacterium]|jgi:hypothetical protein|nr:hypothetical protein [Rhodanobacteraceae bacterium]
MSALWHPAIRADWLVLRRTGTVALLRIVGVPALLLACWPGGHLVARVGRPPVTAVKIAACDGRTAVAHERLLGAVERWRLGWCAALPVARSATTCTLSLVTIAALMASVAFVTVLLLGISAFAPHRGDLVYALAGIDLALVASPILAAMREHPARSLEDAMAEACGA